MLIIGELKSIRDRDKPLSDQHLVALGFHVRHGAAPEHVQVLEINCECALRVNHVPDFLVALLGFIELGITRVCVPQEVHLQWSE